MVKIVATQASHSVTAETAPFPAMQSRPEEPIPAHVLDVLILGVNEKLEDCLNEILHHPKFRHLEGAWLGLAMLVEAVGDSPLVGIDILNVSKEDMREDLEDSVELIESGLFQHIYEREYDQAGGTPYTSVLAQYAFSNTPNDVAFLKNLAQVASTCHCPVIGNVSLDFFGVRDYEAFEDIHDFKLLFEDPVYTKWRALRGQEDARYLGLIFPQILIREPYTYDMFERLYFNETVTRTEDMCWAHATYAFGVLLANSFIKHGWCVHIRGAKTGGALESPVAYQIGMSGFPLVRPGLSLTFSDAQEHKLSEQGFIVLNQFKQSGDLCIFSAPTVQTVKGQGGFTSNDRLAASLPYVFLVSRVAHYQKVIQRENIGTTKESSLLEKELWNWISGLITEMRDPKPELRSQRPLSGGSVKVEPDPANPGFFNVKLLIKPHLQVEGVNADLMLISRVPRGKE